MRKRYKQQQQQQKVTSEPLTAWKKRLKTWERRKQVTGSKIKQVWFNSARSDLVWAFVWMLLREMHRSPGSVTDMCQQPLAHSTLSTHFEWTTLHLVCFSISTMSRKKAFWVKLSCLHVYVVNPFLKSRNFFVWGGVWCHIFPWFTVISKKTSYPTEIQLYPYSVGKSVWTELDCVSGLA